MREYDHTWILVSLILICVCLLCLTIIAIYIIYSTNRHRKRLEELTEYNIHTTANIDMSIPEILNLIIQDSFTDYKIKTLMPLEEGYINSTREDQIRAALVEMVSNRISNAALDKLSLFYNIQNIAAIMADKIYITVMQYVIEHNATVTNQQSSNSDHSFKI